MVKFDGLTHTYTDENGKELISVTTLLQKHNLAPDYNGVKNLKEYADRGTLIHEELHSYIVDHEIGFTEELGWFIKWVNANESAIEFVDSEFMLHNDIIAGTCDFLFKFNGELCRADFKTTTQKHIDYVEWQLSLYDYLDTRKAKHFYLFHFTKTGLEIIKVRAKTTKEIEKLLDDERNERIYTPSLTTSLQEQQEVAELLKYIDTLTALQNEAKAKLEEFKGAMLEKMEEQNIKKIDNALFSITYVAPTTKNSFDSERFKNEHSDLYEKYLKTTQTKSYVKLTIKKGKK